MQMTGLFLKRRKRIFRGVLLNQNRSTLRSEHQLLQRLINEKLFVLNGTPQNQISGPKF
jgi:hypothetical protein